MSTKKITLNGKKNVLESSTAGYDNSFFSLKESYSLSATRADGESHDVTIPSDHFVEFVFDDDTTWFGNAQSLQELFPEMQIDKRSIADGAAELPLTLSSGAQSRSIKSVALKMLNVFAKKEAKMGVHDLALFLEKKITR
jgi:hypothetical protein